MLSRTSTFEQTENIANIKREVGWAYHQCKWLNPKTAVLANRERDELLRSLEGKVNYIFQGSKIYLGKLSPGCMACGKGEWSCLYINVLCNTHCFFCPQDRAIKTERQPIVENHIMFDDPQAYVAYLKQFNFTGVGFSGGETMLVPEKVLSYIRKIREAFGGRIYIWLYTNGKLINSKILKELKRAGLDEIRFNIKADNYRLHKVELARHYINKVAVEIPAVPEDYNLLKKRLHDMAAAGVDYFNIHQLLATSYNFGNLIKRNYTLLHQPYMPVLESELTALKLIRHIVDNDIKLSAQYCSQSYKTTFQQVALRRRAASWVLRDYEGITNSGYMRSLSIKAKPTEIKKIILNFKKSGYKHNLWDVNSAGIELFFHHTLLKFVPLGTKGLVLRYFFPQIHAKVISRFDYYKIRLTPSKTIFVMKVPQFDYEWKNSAPLDIFQKQFVEELGWVNSFKHFVKRYSLSPGVDSNVMMTDLQLLKIVRAWEEMTVGFPEFY